MNCVVGIKAVTIYIIWQIVEIINITMAVTVASLSTLSTHNQTWLGLPGQVYYMTLLLLFACLDKEIPPSLLPSFEC